MNGTHEPKQSENLNPNAAVSMGAQPGTSPAEPDKASAEIFSKKHIRLRAIGINAVTLFCRQLSTLVDVGIPLLKCLQILYQRTSHPKLQAITQHLAQDIEQGSSFSAALEKFPHVFSPFFVNMTKVAEKGGSLDEALREVADVLEKEEIMKQKVRDALAYPFITLLMGVLVIGIMLVGIIPMFGDLYSQSQFQLPWPTKILLALGSPWTLVVLIGLIAAAIYIMYTSGKSAGSKAFYDRYKLKLPIFGPMFIKLYVARFARNFGTLIRGGVPMLQALDVVKQTSENVVVADAVQQAIAHVERGGRLEQPFRDADIFPDVVVDMLATGEEAGKLDLMLFKIAELYEGELDRTVNTLAASLQPILIVVLGVMTAFIAAAMFWPYFKLANFLGSF
jgi:type IV pilus assembly protein PilC